MRRAALVVLAALAAACANIEVAVNPRARFDKVRRVAVAQFAGPRGDAAADAMVQQLVGYGADVVERSRLEAVLGEQDLARRGVLDPRTVKRVGKVLGVDAIVVGTVSDYVPSRSYVVHGQSGKVLVNGVTPLEGSEVFPVGSVPGMPDSQIIASVASVALTARMVDVETGSVMWTAAMSYEGLDALPAMRQIASSFVESLVPVWPSLIRPKR